MRSLFDTPMARRLAYVVASIVIFLIILALRIEPDNPLVKRTLAVGVLMAILWITDAIPLAVTAMIPVALFPFFGIMKGGDVARQYLNSILFLFIGGFVIALAMERWNLHKRIALKTIMVVGHSPTRLLVGFMTGSWLLSMWVSNTATTMMMVPIVIALLLRLEQNAGTSLRRLELALLLGVAYASSVGGMATLVGTAPNLSLARIHSIAFPDAPEVTFAYWLTLGLPVSIALAVAVFLVLRQMFTKGMEFDVEPTVITDEYRSLGKPSFEEKVVLAAFAAFAVLLITRAGATIGGTVIPGWAALFPDGSFIDDGTVAITVALILFFVPARSRDEFVMDRGTIRKLPWSILILLGGGFALARGFQDSGLSAYLGGKLAGLQGLPTVLVVLAVATLVTFLTELTSNTATTQVVLPILASLSTVLGIEPMMLMVPATIAASCAFMLPVATPPNAIIFGTRRLRVADMAAVGLRLNLIAIVVITVMMYVIGHFRF